DYELNGASYSKNYITHQDLMNGANIKITTSDSPNLERGTEEDATPYSFSSELKITAKKKRK
ncbi:MAG: hypothetical protein ACRCZB_00980, partial [Bacteroidales bacterium]